MSPSEQEVQPSVLLRPLFCSEMRVCDAIRHWPPTSQRMPQAERATLVDVVAQSRITQVKQMRDALRPPGTAGPMACAPVASPHMSLPDRFENKQSPDKSPGVATHGNTRELRMIEFSAGHLKPPSCTTFAWAGLVQSKGLCQCSPVAAEGHISSRASASRRVCPCAFTISLHRSSSIGGKV